MKNSTLLLFALLTNSYLGFAQFSAGNSISVMSPNGALSKTHNFGIGLNGNIEYGFKEDKFGHLVSEIGYSIWSSKEGNQIKDNLNSFSLMLGYRAPLFKSVYIETRFGQYFGDLNGFVVIPAIGVRMGNLDLNLGVTINNHSPQFVNTRVAYFWARKKSS